MGWKCARSLLFNRCRARDAFGEANAHSANMASTLCHYNFMKTFSSFWLVVEKASNQLLYCAFKEQCCRKAIDEIHALPSVQPPFMIDFLADVIDSHTHTHTSTATPFSTCTRVKSCVDHC